MAVFQHSYRLRWWARFGPWPMVCRPLLEGRILRGEKRMKGKREYWDVGLAMRILTACLGKAMLRDLGKDLREVVCSAMCMSGEKDGPHRGIANARALRQNIPQEFKKRPGCL